MLFPRAAWWAARAKGRRQARKIIDVICAPARTGFYFDDQRAIKGGAQADGAAYIGTPVTAGFSAVRQAGEAISVMLVLENGEYHFQGWFYMDDDVELMWDFEHHPVVTEELVIYAKWSSEVLVPYTVRYEDSSGKELAPPTTSSFTLPSAGTRGLAGKPSMDQPCSPSRVISAQ